MPDYAQKVAAFNQRVAQLRGRGHPASSIGFINYMDSFGIATDTSNYVKARTFINSMKAPGSFRPKGFKEIKEQFQQIESRHSPAEFDFQITVTAGNFPVKIFRYDIFEGTAENRKLVSGAAEYNSDNAPHYRVLRRYPLISATGIPQFNADQALKQEAIARREQEASEFIQSQAYKNLEKQLQKLMNPPKFRPRTYMTDKLSVKSDPRLLINTVNNLKKALQRRNTSEAPIGRGTSDFFANILKRGEGA